MNATQQLYDLGQSLWLDNITRGILNDGTLERYIRELSVTGLAVKDTVPARLRNRLGIAVAKRAYREYRSILASPRWATLAAAGALPQRFAQKRVQLTQRNTPTKASL